MNSIPLWVKITLSIFGVLVLVSACTLTAFGLLLSQASKNANGSLSANAHGCENANYESDECIYRKLMASDAKIPAPWEDGGAGTMDDDLTSNPFFFFRIKADVKVKDTGEIVKFDYVASCGGYLQRFRHTTSSLISGLKPDFMILPTKSGEAIGVYTPDICFESRHVFKEYKFKPEDVARYGRETYDLAPDDFLPTMFWFPDVNDLSFSFAYVQEAAYTSPYSRMDVLSASVELSNREDWDTWRRTSVENWTQVGVLPGPWGAKRPNSPGASFVENIRIERLNHDRILGITPECEGGSRMDFSPEIQKQVAALVNRTGKPAVRIPWQDDPGFDDYRHVLQHAFVPTGHGPPIYGGRTLVGQRLGWADLGVSRKGKFSRFPDEDETSYDFEGVGTLGWGEDLFRVFPVINSYKDSSAVLGLVDQKIVDRDKIVTFDVHADLIFDREWEGFLFCGDAPVSREQVDLYAQRKAKKIETKSCGPHARIDWYVHLDGELLYSTTQDRVSNITAYSDKSCTGASLRSLTALRSGSVITNCCGVGQ